MSHTANVQFSNNELAFDAVAAPWGRPWEKPDMPILIEDYEHVTRVVLSGRIDIAGAHEIDLPMSSVGGRKAVVIDLAAVDFLASMGMRSLVLTAKSIISKRGRVVLLAPRPEVEEVLRTAGIDELIPIHHVENDAIAAVRSG